MADQKDPRGRGARYDYDLVALREEFLARSMSGEVVSLNAFHREVAERRAAEGKPVMSDSNFKKLARAWLRELDERRKKSDDALADAMVVDHLQQRREILTLAPRLREVLDKVLALYKADLDAQLKLPADQRRVADLGDVKVLAELELQVRRVGAGLPQVHEVVGTVRNEDSRPDAQALAKQGRAFREHLKGRGFSLPEPDAVH